MNHIWGSNIPHDFHDKAQDVHIHKCFLDQNKKVYADIRIPLNSNRKVDISDDVPKAIISEIKDILDDLEERKIFLNEVYNRLKQDWNWSASEESKFDIASKIANVFDLKLYETVSKIIRYNQIESEVYFLYEEKTIKCKLYKMVFDKEKGFSIGEVAYKSGKNIYVSLNEIL